MIFFNNITVQEACRQTNTTYPLNSYMSDTVFPEQDPTKLGIEVEVHYRDFGFNGDTPEELSHRVKKTTMYILRYDITYPYTVIGICTDTNYLGQMFVIKRQSADEDITSMDNCIVIYPDQQYNYYLKPTNDVYADFTKVGIGFHGTILRCDNAEPAYSVIVEYLDNYIRFITADEAICIVDSIATKEIIYKETDVYNFVENLIGAYRIYGSE